jgi:hypothetical protein
MKPLCAPRGRPPAKGQHVAPLRLVVIRHFFPCLSPQHLELVLECGHRLARYRHDRRSKRVRCHDCYTEVMNAVTAVRRINHPRAEKLAEAVERLLHAPRVSNKMDKQA